MIGKTILYSEGRNGVFHQYELLNVTARLENFQRFLYRGSMQMLFLQYELLNVSANEMIGKTALYNEGRYRVSHQCVLLNVTARLENLQSFLYTEQYVVIRVETVYFGVWSSSLLDMAVRCGKPCSISIFSSVSSFTSPTSISCMLTMFA